MSLPNRRQGSRAKPLKFIFHILRDESILMGAVFLGICQTDLSRRGRYRLRAAHIRPGLCNPRRPSTLNKPLEREWTRMPSPGVAAGRHPSAPPPHAPKRRPPPRPPAAPGLPQSACPPSPHTPQTPPAPKRPPHWGFSADLCPCVRVRLTLANSTYAPLLCTRMGRVRQRPS